MEDFWDWKSQTVEEFLVAINGVTQLGRERCLKIRWKDSNRGNFFGENEHAAKNSFHYLDCSMRETVGYGPSQGQIVEHSLLVLLV